MNKNWLSVIVIVFSVVAAMPVCQAVGQDKASKKQDQESSKSKESEDSAELATIRGSLILESDTITEIDWDTIQGTLGQLVALKQPKLPTTWKEMDAAKRQEWITKFNATEQGKKLLEANQKALEERHLQDFRIRNNGKFVVYDVPKGEFEMRIVGQKEVDKKTYVLQHYGRFQVGEAQLIDFSDTRLDVLRLLKLGEQAPSISGKTLSGESVSLADLRGKHVLMAFGLTSNPAFEITTNSIKQVADSEALKDKVQLLTVTVDEDLKEVAKFNEKNGVNWSCLNLGKWDQAILDNYGLRSVPSLWLIDPEGNVVLTGQQFVFELNRTKFPVAKLVEDLLAGRLTIGGEKKEGPTPTEAGQSEDKAPGKKS